MDYTPRRFSKSAIPECPKGAQDPTIALVERAFGSDRLSRSERNRLAEIMYGVFGSGHTYRQAGWAWDLPEAQQLRRILVADSDDGNSFRAYFARDKTALRAVLGSKREMIYVDDRDDEDTDTDTSEAQHTWLNVLGVPRISVDNLS